MLKKILFCYFKLSMYFFNCLLLEPKIIFNWLSISTIPFAPNFWIASLLTTLTSFNVTLKRDKLISVEIMLKWCLHFLPLLKLLKNVSWMLKIRLKIFTPDYEILYIRLLQFCVFIHLFFLCEKSVTEIQLFFNIVLTRCWIFHRQGRFYFSVC